MRKARALSRDERKRLIIHHFAEAIRTSQPARFTCADMARKMDIIPSTKLRNILDEMVAEYLLIVTMESDAGIAGFRKVYELNYSKEGFSQPHANQKATRVARTIRMNSSKGQEDIFAS